ncbi:MAG: hypothetical protein ACP5K1_00400 [Candidatus Bathyarchaeia archaeon]
MSWLLDREIRRELPEEWGGIVPSQVFIEEAERIVRSAEEKGLVLRVMGGIGVAIHSRGFEEFSRRLSRVGAGERVSGQEFSDVDLIGYRRQREEVSKLLMDEGYLKRRATLSSAASERQIYYHPKGWFYVDVFYDKLLVANHPLDFRGRLELDYPTITATDLLLEKVQMWEAFSEKDLKDSMTLIRAHRVAPGEEEESINPDYIAGLLSEDWGFWYTATTNLRRIREFTLNVEGLGPKANIEPGALTPGDIEDIAGKVESILREIDERPKSLRWKVRSRIGTGRRWYNPVETEKSTGGLGIWEAIMPPKQPSTMD